MAYVGCDLSTHNVDLVKLDEESDRAEWVRVPLVGENAIDRARSYKRAGQDAMSSLMSPELIAGFLPGLVNTWSWWWDDVILCALEDPAGRGDTRKIARVQGVVIATIPSRVHVWTLQPAEWRKACGLPGNCSKHDVARFAGAKWQPIDAMRNVTQDALDAWAIAYAARAINESAASVAEGNQTQEEAA